MSNPYEPVRHSKWLPDIFLDILGVFKDQTSSACGQSAHGNYINNMVSVPGSNNKNVFVYTKDMQCDSSGVVPPKKDGINYSEPTGEVEILNEQFVSAFTKEDHTSVPTMGTSTGNTMPPSTFRYME